ncbi:MAG: peptidoglycan glycosyltransferase, partial [Actinobacteria bacterium]|nr:peptidoglycan glycosyltransferase [Actinomycetota bacterium]
MLLLILVAFAGKLVVVQAVDGKAIAQIARDARLSTVDVLGARGEITDATGVVLAGSVTRYNISVNQRLIPEFKGGDGVAAGAAGAAATLAPLLEMDAAELGGKLVGTSAFKYLKKGVLPATAREIAALGIDGINVEQTAERVYPNGTLAGDIIGFTNSNGEGLQGLESALNSRLTGTSGELTYER